MANNKNFIAKNGVSTGDGYAMPDVRPSLLLDFANSKSLDPRITFTRGSTATYWDGHTTTKAEENLLPYSDFSSDWTDEGKSTITLDTDTAPDGTTTAARLFGVNGQVMAYFYDQVSVSNSGKLTGSMYLKEAGQRYAYIQVIAGDTTVRQSVLFDLDTGTQVDTDAQGSPTGVSYSITSVGNNWYRCVVTMDQSGSSNGYLLVGMAQSASPTWNSNAIAEGTFTTSDTIIIWGPQLEERDSVTAYTATTSKAIIKYQPVLQTAASDEARFDHDPVTGESKGLLIEQARTNLVTYSEGTSGWTLYNNGTLKNDVAVAPDGTRAAQVFNYDGGGGVLRINTTSLTNGTTYTVSVYLKSNNADTPSVNIQIGDTTVVSGQALTNEWVRYSGSGTPAVTGYNFLDIEIPSGSDISIWGAQLEQAYFPTSYIPTSGSSASRSGEACYSLDSAFTPSGTFTALAKASLPYDNTVTNINASMFSFGPDRIQLRYDDGTGAQFLVYNPSAVVDLNAGTPSVNSGMTAVQIGQNNFKFSSAGSTVQTDAGGIFDVPDTMYIGNLSNSSEYLNGHIQKIAFYTASLSNATLQQMTEE